MTDNRPLEIDRRSDAGIILAEYLANPSTYKVSIAPLRDDGLAALKRNEGMWTPPLKVDA